MADSQLRSNAYEWDPSGQGSSEFGHSKAVKGDRSRRSWSDREEATFLAALKELVAIGWKSDNGFRAGYLQLLEESMKKEFPKTDIKAHPHVYSKFTT
ncbi:hypothetical protein SASPL_101953 [Salvia splendens]|uniref:Uncharacterized protein n=1 Tax=Salvia splendens TaxID=180675 RepID=A0A8X8YQZ5_SALSN|nr:hypothetical protein SASPL_101953 [Salvia splendens]